MTDSHGGMAGVCEGKEWTNAMVHRLVGLIMEKIIDAGTLLLVDLILSCINHLFNAFQKLYQNRLTTALTL